MKRTIQNLSEHKDVLDALLKIIRTGSDHQVESLLTAIRKADTVQDIAQAMGFSVAQLIAFSKTLSIDKSPSLSDDSIQGDSFQDDGNLDDGIEDDGNPDDDNQAINTELEMEPNRALDQDRGLSWSEDDTISRTAFDPYARVSLESLCDIPLFRVPAKPWTRHIDDALVSHIVSLYFTWEHPCAQFVDQEIFLEEMKHGGLESDFCSQLLVNSLLAMASVRGSNRSISVTELSLTLPDIL